MYDTETPGGGKLALAIAKVKEGLVEIERLKASALAKAYELGGQDSIFAGMVEAGAARNAILLLDNFT